MARSLMVQGTASHVGKTVLTAALCRIFQEDGINVTPFKPQNMALNSFVTEEGLEMGRGQVLQAEAAKLKPHVDMNPVLLKPQSDTGSQIIIHGKINGHLSAKDFHSYKKKVKPFVEESYKRLAAKHDLVVIEGAGSPAEINLKDNDIANMGTARFTDSPVILVGDIDRGGVFAALVGTLELLDEDDRKRVRGFIINKFRGDLSLLKPGLDFLEEKTGLPVLGVVPYFKGVYLQEEDGVHLELKKNSLAGCKNKVVVAVLHLPRISNFTDFDPLAAEPDVELKYVKEGDKIGKVDIIVIPGSKSTVSDLKYLKASGYDQEIANHIQRGGGLIGICGGYQMLGKTITDPSGVEGGAEMDALGYLDIDTVLEERKETCQVEAKPSGQWPASTDAHHLRGYEIHMGRTNYLYDSKPLFLITSRSGLKVNIPDGAMSRHGKVWGTYIHGLFDNDSFRRAMIDDIKREKGMGQKVSACFSFDEKKEEGYRKLAEIVRKNVDIEALYRIAAIPEQNSRQTAINH